MIPLLGAILIASLAGSLHCAGMCGAFVTLACGLEQGRASEKAKLQACYHGGRLVGYALLGAGAGALGQAIDFGASAAGFTHAASLLAAATILLVALGVALRACGVRLPHAPAPKPLQKMFRAGLGLVSGATPTRRALAIGSLTALLPCGWLYAFAIVAAGTAHPLSGAAVMAAFWIGTVPILAAVGMGAGAIQKRFGPRLRAAVTVCIALVSSVILLRAASADLGGVRAAMQADEGDAAPVALPTVPHCPLCETPE